MRTLVGWFGALPWGQTGWTRPHGQNVNVTLLMHRIVLWAVGFSMKRPKTERVYMMCALIRHSVCTAQLHEDKRKTNMTRFPGAVIRALIHNVVLSVCQGWLFMSTKEELVTSQWNTEMEGKNPPQKLSQKQKTLLKLKMVLFLLHSFKVMWFWQEWDNYCEKIASALF